MSHPLTPNLSELSDADLLKKQGELQKRIIYGHQTGNANLISQVEMMLDDYREESMRRDRQRTEKANETNNSKNWDDLIDI